MQIFNPAQNNPALDVDTTIPMKAVLPSTMNVIIATILGISLPCAEDPTLVNDQPLITSTENPEEGPADLVVTEDQASHLAGEGRHTEATPATPNTPAPVTAPHRAIAERRSPRCGRCSPTLYRHQVSHIIPFDSNNEGQFYTDKVPDGQRSFHTTMQIVTKQGWKSLPVNVGPEANVNTIPLSHYRTIFSNCFTPQGHLKKNTLRSIASTWSPHNGQIQQFLGYFIIDIQHKNYPQDYSIIILCLWRLHKTLHADIISCLHPPGNHRI